MEYIPVYADVLLNHKATTQALTFYFSRGAQIKKFRKLSTVNKFRSYILIYFAEDNTVKLSEQIEQIYICVTEMPTLYNYYDSS